MNFKFLSVNKINYKLGILRYINCINIIKKLKLTKNIIYNHKLIKTKIIIWKNVFTSHTYKC